ncbi:uncharacterized protein LOC143887817 [Tasmannia lanceolata]|uniref:uncharacterized protein LOC143887817 n=1 Tax=Tasmannia lanceolata TaxID=3420 RepID=UPI004063FB03
MDTEEKGRNEEEVEILYKTKVVQFLGRSVPIILQNDNGPCPLIAICNVLLLRNNLNLSLDTTEISLQKLLSLVAERLIDSNSNVEDKDAGYVKNQQQNIADAIDLLPRLATGIDVNLHFGKIDDFEFTRERAIFDLLGIELYHGWIVDPQDTDTLAAIGSKSYNSLIGELVSLETRNTGGEDKGNLEEDCIDFAAATTATLGVPSPSLSSVRSFDDSSVLVSSDQSARRGDREEVVELMRALHLSQSDLPTSSNELLPDTSRSTLSTTSPESTMSNTPKSDVIADFQEGHTSDEYQRSHQPDISQDCNAPGGCNNDGLSFETIARETDIPSANQLDQSNFSESGHCISNDLTENIRTDMMVQNQTPPFHFPNRNASTDYDIYQDYKHSSAGDQMFAQTCAETTSTSLINLKPTDNQSYCESTDGLSPAATNAGFHSPDGIRAPSDESEGVGSTLEGSEPIYEGEECILDTGHSIYENREPMYEGEVVLAKQADRGPEGDSYVMDKVAQRCTGLLSIDVEKGELIRNFLKSNASQLTIYGLFCLLEGLKERELCVFFRNNHFSTLFKFNRELYLLATDQGYINQPDLVWEKLNEVNGDTVFMTGTFKEFKAGNQTNDWDEQTAVTSTSDYIASIDKSAQEGSTLNSDLQLAIALQQQEFDHQPQQRQQPQKVPQSSASGHSRLVTGPQVPRSSHQSSSKQEGKSKDKCAVM